MAGSEDVTRHPLVERLLSLGFAPDQFVVFGSGPLLPHGIRTDIADLDVLARGDAWERARREGRPGLGPLTGERMARFFGDRIEVSQGWVGDLDVDGLIDNADVYEGIRFAPLTAVLAYKRILNRPKDISDISNLETIVGHRSGDVARTFGVRTRALVTAGGVPAARTATSMRSLPFLRSGFKPLLAMADVPEPCLDPPDEGNAAIKPYFGAGGEHPDEITRRFFDIVAGLREFAELPA